MMGACVRYAQPTRAIPPAKSFYFRSLKLPGPSKGLYKEALENEAGAHVTTSSRIFCVHCQFCTRTPSEQLSTGKTLDPLSDLGIPWMHIRLFEPVHSFHALQKRMVCLMCRESLVLQRP